MGDRRPSLDLVADVDLVVALVGADPPEAQEPRPQPEPLADQLPLEHELTAGHPVVAPQLLGDAVHVDLERRPDTWWELDPPALGHQTADPMSDGSSDSIAQSTRMPRSRV